MCDAKSGENFQLYTFTRKDILTSKDNEKNESGDILWRAMVFPSINNLVFNQE